MHCQQGTPSLHFFVRIRPPGAPHFARRLPDLPLRAATKLYSLRLQSFIAALRSLLGSLRWAHHDILQLPPQDLMVCHSGFCTALRLASFTGACSMATCLSHEFTSLRLSAPLRRSSHTLARDYKVFRIRDGACSCFTLF